MYFKDQLEKVGIRVTPVVLPVAEYNARRLEQRFELHSVEANLEYADPDAGARNILPGLFSNLDDARMFELFDQQSVEGNPAKRRELVFQLQRRMIEVVNQIPIAWADDYFPAQPEVRGFVMWLGQWSRHRPDHVWLAK